MSEPYEEAFLVELTPNELTREVLKKSARGEDVVRADDAEDMFDKLGI